MDNNLVSYDVTAVTGLEKLVIEEILEKVSGCQQITNDVGHVFFKTKNRFDQLSRLRSVDNVYVIVYEAIRPEINNCDLEKLEETLLEIINLCDWKTGIEVWKETNQKFSQISFNMILNMLDENEKPTFRVSCNRTGDHKFTSPEASSLFGGLINDKFQWNVSLKNFDLEILLTIKKDLLRIAFCLTNESLFKRNIVAYGLTTLKSTIAFSLLFVAKIKPGEIVCDPLCGSGSIPVECSINWPQVYVLCGDNNNSAIEKTQTNLIANQLQRCNVMFWDAKQLPFKTNSIDVFVTDLPFGRRMGSKYQNKTLYPALLKEMARCSRTNSGRIVLLTQDKTNANIAIYHPSVKKYCHMERAFFVKIGNLNSSVYLLRRNNVK